MTQSLDNIQLSASELAEALEITTQRVNVLKNEGTFEQVGKKFNFQICLKAYLERLREQAAGRVGESPDGVEKLDPTYEKARLTKIQGDLAELQLKKALGEVISQDEILEVWQRIIGSARGSLLSLKNKVPNIIHGITQDDIRRLGDEIDDILKKLSVDGDESVEEVKDSALMGDKN